MGCNLRILLCCLAATFLLPSLSRGQGFLPGQELVRPKTRFEITISGFRIDSDTGTTSGTQEQITQKENRLVSRLEIKAGSFLVGGGVEISESVLDTLVTENSSRITRRNLFAAVTLFDIARPYLRSTKFTRKTDLNNLSTLVTIKSNVERESSQSGLTLLFPYWDDVLPFLGYARGAEALKISLEIVSNSYVDESYEYYSSFYELGFIMGLDAGFSLTLDYKRKDSPRVEGVLYALEAGTSKSEEVSIGYQFSGGSVVSLGVVATFEESNLENLSAFEEQEDRFSMMFQFNDSWAIRFSQSTIRRITKFFLTNPTTLTNNRFRRNALSLEWHF